MTDPQVTVLVVDDDQAVARSVARVLRRAGFRVGTTTSAATARARGVRYDVAVVELEIGSDSGVELARDLLQAGQIRSVIFFTRITDSASLRDALFLGPVLSKTHGAQTLLTLFEGLGYAL